jgi:hypothetical protein
MNGRVKGLGSEREHRVLINSLVAFLAFLAPLGGVIGVIVIIVAGYSIHGKWRRNLIAVAASGLVFQILVVMLGLIQTV